MAGYRIDIIDGRNNPVAPLEPPGGGSVPVSGSTQVNDETALAAAITEGAEAVVAASGAGVLPVVTGETPPVLVYLDDGSLIYSPVG